jgi:hypothetical protein
LANVQKQFEQFHAIIRTDYEMNATLREKRDIILDRIHAHLIKNGRPDFKRVSQGSYKMKTGVVPIEDLEYDIDVGLRFSFTEDDYTAKEVRKWVFEAVDGHTEQVEEKGPCIRVTYADGYHVDLVSYAFWTDAAGEDQYRLAHKTRGWVAANPIKLIEHVNEAREPYEGTEDNATKTDQFRRCVRDLRRWNDVAIPYEDRSKPTGLALVLLAIKHLQPAYTWDGKSDDRLALEQLAGAAANTYGRIVAKKPTPEYEDMFGRLSDKQMDELKGRFKTLYDTLVAADKEKDPRKACKLLQQVFGDDFPVPPEEDTAEKTRGPAIVTTSVSA